MAPTLSLQKRERQGWGNRDEFRKGKGGPAPVQDVYVDKQGLEKLKSFFRQIAADERNSAVLKKAAP